MISESVARKLAEMENACYVVDIDVIRSSFIRLKEAFQSRWKNTVIAYSYKTNYDKAIIDCLRQLGARSQVVSQYEYRYAMNLGVDASDIVFNGPTKSTEVAATVAAKQGIVNVDNLRELWKLQNYAKKHDLHLNIGLRIDVAFFDTVDSRFGIRYGSDDFLGALSILNRSSNLKCVGVHSHYKKRTLCDYATRMNMMIDAFAYFKDATYIDIGSGMNSVSDDGKYPSFEQYAETAASVLKARSVSEDVTLIIEPGLPIVANAVSFMTTVKSISNDKTRHFARVDCSTHWLPSPSIRHDLPVTKYDVGKQTDFHKFDIVGFTCVQEDVLGTYTGLLGEGDIVLFGNCGAYGQSMAQNFIMPVPASYAVDGQRIACTKRSVDISDEMRLIEEK